MEVYPRTTMTTKPVTDVIDGAQFVRTTDVNGQTAVLTYFGENKIGQHCVEENGMLDTLNSNTIDIGYDNTQSEVKQQMRMRIDELNDL